MASPAVSNRSPFIPFFTISVLPVQLLSKTGFFNDNATSLAEAARAYGAFRDLLADELGVAPTRQMEELALRGDLRVLEPKGGAGTDRGHALHIDGRPESRA